MTTPSLKDARIAVLEVENASLLEVLRPFAEAAAGYAQWQPSYPVAYKLYVHQLRRAAAAYPTHSEGGEANTPGERRNIAQPLSDEDCSAAALLSALKSAIAKRHRDNHDTSPPCAAEPDLEFSDVKAVLETLGASPSPSALTEEGVTEEAVRAALNAFHGQCGRALTDYDVGERWRMKNALASAISPKGGTAQITKEKINEQ